ncbi:MAG TPA: TasA family protein [Candidatus Dojkabacteria bacterium]|nr:TasA family protein [Candidatus Dojkabacteria bacterium]
MNLKTIAPRLVTIAATGALLVGGTMAYFSDEGTSSGNVFSAGTLDLKLDDKDTAGEFSDDVTASLEFSNMSPGNSQTGFVSLHNDGSLPIAEVLLGATQPATNDNDGNDLVLSSNLSDVLNLTVATDTTSDCVETVEEGDQVVDYTQLSGFSTLTALVNVDYDSLPGLPDSTRDYYLCVMATMDPDAGNAYQGDSVTVSLVFTAHQVTTQP